MTVYEYKGTTGEARGDQRRLRGRDRKQRPRRPAKCGTNSGYYRHLRITKTVPCADCLCAHAAAEALAVVRRRLGQSS